MISSRSTGGTSQAFFLSVYRQTVVRVQLSLLVDRGVHVHEALPDYTRRWLLKRIRLDLNRGQLADL